MTDILHIEDAIRERQLESLMQQIKETQDREARLVLWGEYKSLHAARSRQVVNRMEERAGLR